ncbi:transposon Tf2-6 polyprotein [Trichonephila clavipes]|nr:transposon Tf2-6 polyprotein [Trichonephila clavipes]
MEQQIADLLRQNQDLIRALQIRDDSHSHKVTVQFDKFDEENENFDSFLERFETYLDVQNVPTANRAKVFVSSLSAKLYQLLKNLLAPDIPSDQTLDKLKDALKKHLTPKPLIIPSRHKFLNRKQTEGEGISTYIAELRALAMNCDYDKDMLNIMLRDVFVSGLRDKMILDRLFEEDNINLEKTLNIALAMEKAFRGTNDIMGRAINSMKTFKKHMDKNPILQKAERKIILFTMHRYQPCKKRIVDLFQVNVISVGKLGTLNRHASHLKRQMRNRLNKNRFLWSKDCQVAFEQIKKEICSPKILVHYDPSLPLTLASDASPVGIGCVLSHVYPDGSERPIASQTFDSYFWFKRGLPVLAATRLLHYALILQSFEFDIIFRKTIEHGNADFLSRLPKTSEELEVKDDITIFQMSQIEALPVTSKELRQETSKDIELGPLLRALREGKDLQGREAQYTIEDGCIMYGQRVCIPRKFDVGDRVAVRVYRAANTRWKFGTIVNQDGVLHYIIDVQGTLVRRHVDQIRSVGDKVQENIIPLMHQRFPSSEVRENNSNIQHAETAEDISKDQNKELGSSSVQGVPSTDVAVPDLSQSSAKETDSRRGVHQFQTGHFLGVPGESGGLRRDLFFKEEEMWYI